MARCGSESTRRLAYATLHVPLTLLGDCAHHVVFWASHSPPRFNLSDVRVLCRGQAGVRYRHCVRAMVLMYDRMGPIRFLSQQTMDFGQFQVLTKAHIQGLVCVYPDCTGYNLRRRCMSKPSYLTLDILGRTRCRHHSRTVNVDDVLESDMYFIRWTFTWVSIL